MAALEDARVGASINGPAMVDRVIWFGTSAAVSARPRRTRRMKGWKFPYSTDGALEMNADILDGAPNSAVRSTVENAATLKFLSRAFEGGG